MFDFEKVMIQSQAQAIILQLENDFPDDEEEQDRKSTRLNSSHTS